MVYDAGIDCCLSLYLDYEALGRHRGKEGKKVYVVWG